MGDQALRERGASVVELKEAMRQVSRYRASHNPSTRIMKQKIAKVEEKSDAFKQHHYTYCRLAKLDLNDEEATAFFNNTLDEAADCCDEAQIFIEEQENNEAATIETTQNTANVTKEIAEREAKITQLRSIVESEKTFTNEIINKMNDIIMKNELTEANAALVRSHDERLSAMDESLTKSWKDAMALHSTPDDLTRITNELQITDTKVIIQEARSKGAVFIELCKPKDDVRADVSDTASVASVSETTSMLKPPKVKFPEFSGDIRDFARFQREFENVVKPFYTDLSQLAYVMKEQCLKGNAKALVRNIEGIDPIWKRLKEKYGETMDLVDIVIKGVEKLPSLKHSDDAKFISMVDLLERDLQDLEAIQSRHNLANEFTVKLVESKLSRQMYLEWVKRENTITGNERFDKLFVFLKEERRCIEKLTQRTPRAPIPNTPNPREQSNAASGGEQNNNNNNERPINKCLIHPNARNHFTRRCSKFTNMSDEERVALMKTTKACVLCLSITHRGRQCPFKEQWGPCGLDGCLHHHARGLHRAAITGLLNAESEVAISAASIRVESSTLLLVQEIPTQYGYIFSFFDNGSTISLVSTSFVVRHNMKGLRVAFDLITVGGNVATQQSYLHEIPLIDANGETQTVKAYQIDEICGEMRGTDVTKAAKLFNGLSPRDVSRKNGHVELLIGAKRLSIHPKKIAEVEDLLLYKSMFGTQRILAGTHHTISGNDYISSAAQKVAHARIQNVRVMCQKNLDPGIDFFSAEEFGVKVTPNCEQCRKCKNCTQEIHNMSQIEQRELKVIQDNLVLDPVQQCWTTPYPFKQDPSILEDNRNQAIKILTKVENRVLKSEQLTNSFREQYNDYVKRNVFRKISDEEMESYKGPVFYVTVHEVLKEDSTSTPLRLVINSSLKHKGRSYNDIMMKGPNPNNDLFAIQLRFRCHIAPLVCDLKKMYHSVKTTEQERHTRRIVWRDLDPKKPIETYGIETVTFGDRPAAAIATVALRKTAEIHENISKVASQKIIEDSYVDDIVTGAENHEACESLKENIPKILSKGGFEVKGFVTAGDEVSEESIALLGSGDYGRVLGVQWDPKKDVFVIKVRVNLSRNHRSKQSPNKDLSINEIPSIVDSVITRAMLLSIVNSCYDPYGLASALTVQMKVALRDLHSKELNISWDQPLSSEIKQQWVEILMKMKQAEKISFKRCVKPPDTVGKPMLLISSDGSEDAMCATTHIRWECEGEVVRCYLWAAKTRVTPLKKMTIPRVEMQAAMMSTR